MYANVGKTRLAWASVRMIDWEEWKKEDIHQFSTAGFWILAHGKVDIKKSDLGTARNCTPSMMLI